MCVFPPQTLKNHSADIVHDKLAQNMAPWPLNSLRWRNLKKTTETRKSLWPPHLPSSPKSEKWKLLTLTLCDPMGYTVHGILQARILEWVAVPFSRDLPNPGIEPRSPALQADSLPAEPQGKPKNTAVGCLSLLKQIFLTQELNQGLLHCRQTIPTELSGKPFNLYTICFSPISLSSSV